MKVKQIIALVVVIALLMTGSVLVTFAYLTRQAQVTNTFTVGDIIMKLDEAKVDLYGKEEAGAARVTENQYKLIPGHTYTKDPTVTIAKDSEPCYVRMLVTVTDYADLCAVVAKEGDMVDDVFLLQNFVGGWDSAKWPCQIDSIEIDKGANTATYEFRYYDVVDATALNDEGKTTDQVLPALFTSFEIPEGIFVEDLSKLAELKIIVVAHAMQADGFNTAAEAWDNFSVKGTTEEPPFDGE